MWRIDVGPNIKICDGHNDMVTAYDMDGDGNRSNEIPATAYPADYTNINLLAVYATPIMGVSGFVEYFIDTKTDRIEFTFDKEGFRQALGIIKGLVDDKLLDPNSFTQDRNSHDAMTNRNPNILGSFFRAGTPITDPARRNDWVVTGALAADNGVRLNAVAKDFATTGASWFVTSNCRYPEAAFLLGDYLVSPECTLISRWGWEGEDWMWVRDYTGDKSKLTNFYGYNLNECHIIFNEFVGTNNVKLNQWGSMIQILTPNPMQPLESNRLDVPDYEFKKSEADIAVMSAKIGTYDTTVNLVSFTPQEAEVLAECWTPIRSYFAESFARFCLGDLSLERDWGNYLSTLKAMGLDRVVEVWNNSYKRMK